MELNSLIEKVKSNLHKSTVKKRYRSNVHPLAGHCYVASEVLWNLLGGINSDYFPYRLKIKETGDSHWFLKHNHTGNILDITAEQYDFKLNYDEAKRCMFLYSTSVYQPSKRSLKVLKEIANQ